MSKQPAGTWAGPERRTQHRLRALIDDLLGSNAWLKEVVGLHGQEIDSLRAELRKLKAKMRSAESQPRRSHASARSRRRASGREGRPLPRAS